MAGKNITHFFLFSIALVSCSLIYLSILISINEVTSISEGSCCRGMKGLELVGRVVKSGSYLKVNSSYECCNSCKATCNGHRGGCLCDSWVFCGDQYSCGSKFGECLLKQQYDIFDPDWKESGGSNADNIFWTSGFVFGKIEAIIRMETHYGTLRIKLHPECAPRSYMYILELLASRHCVGCKFYRAEGRGKSWYSKGNHLTLASYGPQSGFIQGVLEAEGVEFKKIPLEECSVIQRGSVAWIGSGPEFLISLANHQEWKKTCFVFGHVLPEDMEIAEKIAALPTVPDVWNNVNVSVLKKPVSFWLQRNNKCAC